ncbi:MAG: hypothetical protein IT443_00255 [Phycisphaeraceae bacterium]|nr:hypothetical protein [Phycisphaeraceae bacterium]
MHTRFFIVTVTLLAMLAGMLTLTSCNTWKGAGKDVEKTGDAMQGK